MDFKLPPDLVALQTRIRAFVTQELQAAGS